MRVPLEVGEYIDQEILPKFADGYNTAEVIYEDVLETLYRDVLDGIPEHLNIYVDLESEKLVSDYWMAPKNKQAIIDYIEDAWKDWYN